MASTDFQRLRQRHQEASETISRLEHLHGHIVIQQELVALVRDQLRDIEFQTATLRQIAEMQDHTSDRIDLLHQVDEFEHALKSLQVASRRAVLASKRNVERQAQLDRQSLFSSSDLKQRKKPQGNALQTSTNITESLQRTQLLMQQEIEKSAESARESTHTLQKALKEYGNLDALLNLSKQVIGSLEQGDWMDRMLLLFGLLFFSLVVAYIIKRRTWDVGMSMLGWFMGWNKSKAKAAKAAATQMTTVVHTLTTASPDATTSTAVDVTYAVRTAADGAVYSTLVAAP
ncbi:hypothetical protein BZG36_04865 [Bifiguratus adelaidae]|uniref:Sec20 C-terminal domain-containing protein n=1 Tax=Bifiguratus adelaidae TaxID=1938954 RepID=A0A261XUH1_9FUNG|nr:hypothetical protein BZG36_04865 [Bifiguratus adelaidae]